MGPAVFQQIEAADRTYGTHAFNGGYSANALTGNGFQTSRNRLLIYRKWQSMVSDPVISSALKMHCTAALGGHETSGDTVFIELKPEMEKNKAMANLVKETRDDLAPIFNRIAYSLAFNAASYGDSYGRLYPARGKGIVDVYVDEMVMPMLVQPYERGSKTMGFVVYVGQRQREKLTMAQMVRMRLPRTIYEPQPLAVEIAWKMMIAEDDIEKIDLVPAIAGGSFLQGCEEAYDRYIASLIALVGQRAKGSIDASWLKVNVSGMTKEQQDALLSSVENAQNYLKALQRQAISTKNPILEAIRFLLPVSDEKQITSIESTGNNESGQGYTVDDVMLHAKLLAGALGIDLSMLGFSELLSGGLGDGGFFRMSVQAAERSRMLRVALAEAFNHMIDVHLLYKHGVAFAPSDRPWVVNFYGTISALESERQKTRDAEIATGQSLAQALEGLKALNLDEKTLNYIISKIMKLEEDAAIMLAKALVASVEKEKASENAAPAAGGGGFVEEE